MPLPLYRTISEPKCVEGNAGLWYDKFCDMWNDDFNSLGDNGKKEWIRTVVRNVGDEALLREIKERVISLISNSGGKAMLFRTTAPFVTGLGRSHPVENGFAWHHTLGVPYLPGSSVKGIVRAWARLWRNLDNGEIRRIFGPDGAGSVGSVIFLDAMPVRPVELKAEIMTPHYGPYYRGDKPPEGWPADWHSPVPIPFLAVAEGQEFLFGVIPRKEATQDCEKVIGWLKEALQEIGAGAKTAVGYGRFACIEAETPEEAAPEPMTPGREWLEKLAEEMGKSVEEIFKTDHKMLFDSWNKIENAELKRAVFQEIKRTYQTKGWWDNPLTNNMKKTLSKYKEYETKEIEG
ncbi:MAG: type III-B CRISPR module RAMP protein Cmr6 [Methanothrix sp.]|jgi:CRISPR-associated protein Cmr6|uniref:type III-B CRISPR module RAMP protein Cmr6 n=1 Tax=Methanothrix sp. TaxID=90426 RepID=UPI00247B6FD8|nr:type III-B CRISPR module RAMP protein Cmr6 [Methanothrix sp.]